MTKEQLAAGLNVLMAVADAIRELGKVPSGHLYVMLMAKVDLQGYESIIRTLVNSGVIRQDGDLLVWNVN